MDYKIMLPQTIWQDYDPSQEELGAKLAGEQINDNVHPGLSHFFIIYYLPWFQTGGDAFQSFRVIVRAKRGYIFVLLKCLRAPALFGLRVNWPRPQAGVMQMNGAVRVAIRDLVQFPIIQRIFLII